MSLSLNKENWKEIQELIATLVATDPEYHEGFKLIEENAWIQYGKYQSRQMVFQTMIDGKYWLYYENRSGSQFTDWYYDDVNFVDVHEVEQVETVVKIWRKK